jgi:hypothetical protein
MLTKKMKKNAQIVKSNGEPVCCTTYECPCLPIALAIPADNYGMPHVPWHIKSVNAIGKILSESLCAYVFSIKVYIIAKKPA